MAYERSHRIPAGPTRHAVLARAPFVALLAWALLGSRDIALAIAQRDPDAWMTVATAAVVLVAALVSSIAGFAFAALAGGALAYLKADPVGIVRTVVVCSLAIQVYGVWKLRGAIRWRPLLVPLLGGILTLPAGVWLLVRIDAAAYAGALGALLVTYGVYLLRPERRTLRAGAWSGFVAGAFGGVTGGLAGLSGASVTIWCALRGWDKERQRGLYQPFILVMQVLTLACLHWYTPLTADTAQDIALVPFALFGAIGGFALYRRMTNRQFERTTSVLLLVSGVGLVVRAM